MKDLFTKPLLSYVIAIFVIILLSGLGLSLIIENVFQMIPILVIEFIVLVVMLLQMHHRFIKPVHVAADTVAKLVDGNYQSRILAPDNGSIGGLNSKINQLARNLSELSIQEQMHAEQLSTVIDNTESGLVLIDEKGYIHLVNRKFISIFGNTPKDYIGYLYYEVLDNEKIHKTVQETFLYEKNIKESFIQVHEIGRNFIEIVGAPIFNDRNMLRGAVLVFYDITELKNLELMRKDFVANVSHELKTPITSIRGFAETLVDGAIEIKETRDQFIAIIHEESKRIQLLIDDLLTLSKLEQDDFMLNLTEINMHTIVDEITPLMKQQAKQKNITFTVHSKGHLIFTCDPEKLKQVMINLLANAINYTPEDGEVTLNVDQENEYVRLQVSDTGIGIAKESIPRIFERFYRVDKDRSRYTGGTGLGLAIVKHIVEAHEGKINVESEVGEGTTFTVKFPREQNQSNV